MPNCDCEIYEICQQCAPNPEAYERAVQVSDEIARRRVEAPRKLTLPELNHLFGLLEAQRESGIYTGPREQCYARTERLIEWCSAQIQEYRDAWIAKHVKSTQV